MNLSEYIPDQTRLAYYISNGLVTVRKHSSLPLSIYCYGRKAVYDNIWDEITTKTRGLIVDKTGEIIARPYEKFFAYETEGRKETYGRNVEKVEQEFGQPIITEKVNGCLGTFWKYGIHWGIASKGSFHSPHAQFATKWMEEHIEHVHTKLVFPEGYTPVFEIVCQEVQPHVIKYDYDGLVLLNFINIETGEEMDRCKTLMYAFSNGLEVTPYVHKGLKDALNCDSDVLEGYVATYNRPGQTPLKLKIKFPTFLKNRKTFYEELRSKELPENEEKYKEIFNKATSIVQQALVSCTTRKEFADFFTSSENIFYAPACFALMDYDTDKEHQKRTIRRLVERSNREAGTKEE